jgi:hypothetical protein
LVTLLDLLLRGLCRRGSGLRRSGLGGGLGCVEGGSLRGFLVVERFDLEHGPGR